MDTIIAYTSGGAKGNPGPAAAGVYITTSTGEAVWETKKALGNATTNFAEYYGVMLALQTLEEIYGQETQAMQFELSLANELVKKQLAHEEPIKEPGLVPMFIEIHNMQVVKFPHLSFNHVAPEKNIEASRLVSEALEGK